MEIIYDFAKDRDLSRFHLEGNGKFNADGDKLIIETFYVRNDAKATNVWLRDVILPDDFEISFSFSSNAVNGNSMIIFNALPLSLDDFFDDPRHDARYIDLTSFGRIQAYTIGFHRGVYGRPSVLRKLGGRVPDGWENDNKRHDAVSEMKSAMEPLSADDLGKRQNYLLRKTGNRILFNINGDLLHDYTDNLEYPYCDAVLMNGRMGFRNFFGPAVDVYESLLIKKI